MPSTKYSFGIPRRTPLRSRPSSAVKSSAGRSSEVESIGSRPGDRIEQQRAIACRTRQRADLIQRRSKGHQPVARNAPVAWLQANASAERSRLADRAAGIRTQGGGNFAGGDRGRRAAAGSAGDARGVPRIASGLESGVFGRRTHGELVHIQSAKWYRAGGPEPRDDRGIVGRGVALRGFSKRSRTDHPSR